MGKAGAGKQERKTAAAADRHRKGAVRVAGTGGGLRRRLLVLAEPAARYLLLPQYGDDRPDGVERNTYIPQAFVQGENGWISYPDALQGVDVSVYQGEIDWQAVADAGVDFAIIRVGYRGYSQGAIQPDTNFQKNMEGALKAGLDVGVYFFSQATTVREAEEEADYVLEAIRNYPVTYPVVFDWEFIDGQQARTDEIDGERMTECAKTFCELVRAGGYTPMVYFNQEQGYLYYQLDQLDEFSFWLAEYDEKPDFFYNFAMWQYTHTGTVPGIPGNVDLNLAFQDLSKK